MAEPVRPIGNVDIRLIDRPAALHRVWSAIEDRQPAIFAFCNAHLATSARKDPELARILKSAIVFNDGIGIDLASKLIYGQPFPDNLNGTDFTPQVLAGLRRPTRVFLIGSPPGIAEKAAENLMAQHPMVRIVGVQHGFFTQEEKPGLIDRIRAANPELILVGMGNPRQEFWAHSAIGQVDSVILCIGAFLDFSAGRVSRAPPLVRKLKGEWIWRLLLEPRRLTARYTLGAVDLLKMIAADYRAVRRNRGG